jgi:hypothetical protein
MEEPKEGTVAQEPVNPEPPVTEPEKTTFTIEDVKRLVAEEAAKFEEQGYKKSQRALDRKDKEIATLKGTPANVDTNVDAMRKVVKALKASGGDESAIKEAEDALNEADVKVKAASQLTYQQRIINENQNKFNDLIEKSGLDPEDSRLSNYDLAFEMAKQNGDFTVPERILNKIIKSVPPKVTKDEVKPMSEEEIKKRVDEGIKAEMIKRGLLKSDVGAVSGASTGTRIYTEEQIQDRSFWEANKDDIRLAQREGRIK